LKAKSLSFRVLIAFEPAQYAFCGCKGTTFLPFHQALLSPKMQIYGFLTYLAVAEQFHLKQKAMESQAKINGIASIEQ
jgi:hypothetical protein